MSTRTAVGSAPDGKLMKMHGTFRPALGWNDRTLPQCRLSVILHDVPLQEMLGALSH